MSLRFVSGLSGAQWKDLALFDFSSGLTGLCVCVCSCFSLCVLPPPRQQDLFRVLKAYTLHRPDEVYCQAQAPIAAVLLMHMPAEVSLVPSPCPLPPQLSQCDPTPPPPPPAPPPPSPS